MCNDFLIRAAALRHAADDPATDARLGILMIETAADMEAAAADDEEAAMLLIVSGTPVSGLI
jgi:hypothetical protein